MSSKKVIKILLKNGWKFKSSVGSHWQFVNEKTNVKITVPHPRKDLDIKTLNSIKKQSGLNF